MTKRLPKIIGAIFLFFLISGITAAQTDKAKYQIKPTLDPHSQTKVYIPKNLDECFLELKKMLAPEIVAEMKTGSEKDMILYHFSLGRWMRNNWGLWGVSALSKYFHTLGIYHPDTISNIILDSFWRYLNGKPIRLEKQVKSHKKYWRKTHKKNLAELRKTVRSDPTKDFKKAIAKSDLRFVGVMGFALEIPGVPSAHWKHYKDTYGVRIIPGTSDAYESIEHQNLNEKAREYAATYNKLLMQYLRKSKKEN